MRLNRTVLGMVCVAALSSGGVVRAQGPVWTSTTDWDSSYPPTLYGNNSPIAVLLTDTHGYTPGTRHESNGSDSSFCPSTR
jgi:hypothetical protein